MPSIESLEKLLAADPRDPFVLYGLALEYAKRSDHTIALTFYARCLDADPTYLYAYFHGARSMIALDREPDAAAAIRTGIEHARQAGDNKALNELAGLLDTIT